MGKYDAQRKAYWDARPEAKRASQRRRSQNKYAKRRALIIAAKERPCTDCGIDWLPAEVMQLDHVRGEKSFNLTSGCMSVSMARLIEELEKCDPRCPNCHAMRHFEEKTAPAASSHDLTLLAAQGDGTMRTRPVRQEVMRHG